MTSPGRIGGAWVPLLVFVFGGCSGVEVRVNAWLSDHRAFPWPDAGTVRVVAETNPINPLFERQVAAQLRRLLADRGYRIADDQDEPADYVLACWFGVDGGQVRTETVPVRDPPVYKTTRYYTPGGHLIIGRTYYYGRTRYVPYSYTVYQRRAILTLYQGDVSPTTQSAQDSDNVVWQATMISPGRGSDLRRIVPYLLVAAMEYWGEDSEHEQAMTFSRKDRRILRLTGSD